jgi:hypothetical protein
VCPGLNWSIGWIAQHAAQALAGLLLPEAPTISLRAIIQSAPPENQHFCEQGTVRSQTYNPNSSQIYELHVAYHTDMGDLHPQETTYSQLEHFYPEDKTARVKAEYVRRTVEVPKVRDWDTLA